MRWIGRWFWAGPRDGETWALTFLRVIGNLLRSGFTLVVVAIAIYIGAYEIDRRADLAEKAGVTVSVYHRDHAPGPAMRDACSSDYPLIVVVENRSPKAVISLEIELTARTRGMSENVLQYSDRRIEWSYVVPPNYILPICRKTPATLVGQDLVYSGELVSYALRLKPSEPWMMQETQGIPLKD